MRNGFESTFIGRPNTRRTQLSLWRTNIEPHVCVSDYQLNEPFIRTLVNKWSHLKPATIQQLISIANRYVAWKTGQKLDCSRIASIVSRSRPKIEKVIWSIEQTDKALDVARHTNKWLYRMILVGLHTGARIDEIRHLTVADLDFSNKLIHIKDSKNGLPRKVPMTGVVAGIIKDLVASGEANKDVNRPLKRLSQMVEIPEITYHALRHMFITRGLDAGVSPKKLSKITGHSVRVLTEVYWRTTGDISTNDVAFMEKV